MKASLRFCVCRLDRMIRAIVTCAMLAAVGSDAHSAPVAPAAVTRLIGSHCLACHDRAGHESGLNLEDLAFDPDKPSSADVWESIYDRVSRGEMPPPEAKRPAAAEGRGGLRGGGWGGGSLSGGGSDSHCCWRLKIIHYIIF